MEQRSVQLTQKSKWYVVTDPEGACGECYQGAPEAWLLALRRYALVHALAQPDICLHVPRVKQDFDVWSELDALDLHVRCAIPAGLAVRSEASEAQARKDGSTLCEALHDSWKRFWWDISPTSVKVQIA